MVQPFKQDDVYLTEQILGCSLKGMMMTDIIGADAAKLAGLQIDQLQKMRSGKLTVAHMEWYLGLDFETRELLLRVRKGDVPREHLEWFLLNDGERMKCLQGADPKTVRQPTKFVELLDFRIRVPSEYVHETRVETFFTSNETLVRYRQAYFQGAWLHASSVPLQSEQRLRARVLGICDGCTATREECLTLLSTHKALGAGFNGMSLVLGDIRRVFLPRGKRYICMDTILDYGGKSWLPYVHVDEHGTYSFDFLVGETFTFNSTDAFISFTNRE